MVKEIKLPAEFYYSCEVCNKIMKINKEILPIRVFCSKDCLKLYVISLFYWLDDNQLKVMAKKYQIVEDIVKIDRKKAEKLISKKIVNNLFIEGKIRVYHYQKGFLIKMIN